MKMRNKMAVLALALLGIAGASELYSTGAYARVCFLVGGCRTKTGKLEKFLNSRGETIVTNGVNINPTVLDQDCESLGFKKCKSPDLSSMKCIKNGEVWTERCMCNEDGEYPYMYGDDMNDGNIMPLCCTASCPNYMPPRDRGASVHAKPYTSFNPGTCNPTPGEECTDSQGTHYKHKICKARFKYVTSQEDLNKLQSWNYPATVIGAPSGTYTGTDPCDEKYGLPDNAVVHRYGSYSCNAKYQYMEKDIPSDAFTIDTTKAYSDHEYCFTVDADEDNNINKYPASYRKCSGKADAGGFWQATCSDGRYSFKSENWDGLICHLCKPTNNGGSGGGSGGATETEEAEAEDEGMPKEYTLYYANNFSSEEVDKLVEMADEWSKRYGNLSAKADHQVKITITVLDEHASDRLQAMVAGGEKHESFELITLYPLVTVAGTDWKTSIGVQSVTGDSKWLDAGVAEGNEIDIPLTIFANMYDGRHYEEYCTDAEKTDPISVKYMGWLSGIGDVYEEFNGRRSHDPDHLSDPYYSLKDPEPQTYDVVNGFIPAIGDIGCEPSRFQRSEELGIAEGDYTAWFDALQRGDDLTATGGDKCLNYVLGLNANVKMPIAVSDDVNGILYIIETKPRASLEGDFVEENGDYAGKFLLWTPKYGDENGRKEAICTYTNDEYEAFHEEYLQTYPRFNSAWLSYHQDFGEFVDNHIGYAEESTLWKTYLGGDKGGMIGAREEGEPYYSDYMNSYYQENFDNVMNGKLEWSYPWSKR